MPILLFHRSGIHGRGLYCVRNIAAGELVIEYSGVLIRSSLTDKREKYYDSKVKDLSKLFWGYKAGYPDTNKKETVFSPSIHSLQQ